MCLVWYICGTRRAAFTLPGLPVRRHSALTLMGSGSTRLGEDEDVPSGYLVAVGRRLEYPPTTPWLNTV